MRIEMAVEDGSMDGYSMELIKQSYKNLHCSNPYLLNLLDENMRRDNFEIIFDSKVPKNEIHLCKGDITKTLKVLDLPHNF